MEYGNQGLVVSDRYDQAILDGRAFMVSNAARETALAVGGTSFSDTAPAFILDVPSGTGVVPLEIDLRQGGTVAGGMVTVLVTLSDKVRRASGGTAHTPQSMRFDELNTAGCSFYTGPTANANADDISLFSGLFAQDLDGAVGVSQVHWSARDSYAPYLVGPASLVVYTFAGSTQPSWFFTFKWAEVFVRGS
jgi:hypothetical protein